MGYIYNSQKEKSVADKIETVKPEIAVPKPVDTNSNPTN